MAGVPFEPIARLATPESSRIARELLVARYERATAAAAAEKFFESRERLLSGAAYSALRLAVRSESAPAEVVGDQPAVFTNYALAAHSVAALEAELETSLLRETEAARAALIESSRSNFLPQYLVFGGEGVRNLLARQLDQYPHDLSTLPARKNPARKVEQTLLLYLQRIAAKNDTFSQFGPSAWGRIDAQTQGIASALQPGIARREVFLERWTAHSMAAALNQDAEIFSELSPRLNPNGTIAGNTFVLRDTGETQSLSDDEVVIVHRCDGRTPVHALGVDTQHVRALVDKNVIRCAVEVPALEPHAFSVLRDDVERWRAGAVREKWLSILHPIAELPERFARVTSADDRQQLLDEARARLNATGAPAKTGQRFLYAAVNPIGEECFRESNFSIDEKLISEVATTAAPWIDFWRDSYAYIASRVAAGLRQVFAQAAPNATVMPLPAFLRACEVARLPLAGPGLVVLAAVAFQEVKAAFAQQLQSHLQAEEYELTTEDCHVIRREFEYPKFDEYTYPSADLQISAESTEAIRRGDYEWIVGELHPPVALLHHGFYWSCPDKTALNRAFAASAGGKASAHFGFFAADFASHTTVRLFDAIPRLANFVAPERANPAWRVIAPGETDVYIDPATEDVCLRRRADGEFLGSFARAWVIPLGFHPFQFGLSPQTPRLRCGNVIVQRRSWTITHEEFGTREFQGISRELVVAVEALRARRGLPRHVFMRPTERALRRSGAEGRDKDTKPVFVDLESYLFLEIFHRWLVKAGELELTEMLPDPNHLCWQEPDGHRTFELRTLVVPRAA
jgi:lantibiotic biosynthesis dehydratase-like protein